MNKMKTRVLLALVALLAAQLACNMPATFTDPGQSQLPTDEPGPSLTLTALFAVTPVSNINATATSTLPPVVTATPVGGAESTPLAAATATSGSANPTATTQPGFATATLAATARPATATMAIPTARPRAQVVAKYMSTPPTIDGDWSEWKNISTEYPANHVVWGRSNWTGEDDLSASFHIGWDDNNLYIAAKVRDDKYVQNARGEYIFQGDSLELVLDTKLMDDYYSNTLGADDYQLGINPGRPDVNGTLEAYLWMPRNQAGPRTNVKIASRQEAGVYRVEAAIPWSVFGVKPAAGMYMGFGFAVSDNDNASENLQQSMVSNNPDRRLADPTTWGSLQLVK